MAILYVVFMVIAFAATMIFYKDDKKTAEETATGDRRAEGGSVEAEGASETVPETDGEGKKAETRAALLHQTQLYSPLRGRVLKLETLKDDAFASGVLGAYQRVLLILPCHSNDNEKRFIIEMYLDSISV